MQRNNDGVNFVYTNRYNLSDKSLQRVTEFIKETYGLDVERIDENERGYVFIGKYNQSIGDITYDVHTAEYRPFNYHLGSLERIREYEHNERIENRRRKFKLQRNRRIGAFITAASLTALIAFGAIRLANKPEPTNIAVVEHINTVTDASDILLISWANYAMGEISDTAYSSDSEFAQNQRMDLYSGHYAQMMLNYYNYLDQLDSNLPPEIVGNSLKTYHDTFRREAYLFDEEVQLSMFSSSSFNNTPYADAVVYDQSGNPLTSGNLYGENNDSYGNTATYGDNANYLVYVPATSIPNNDFTMENLPSNSLVLNNQVYVTEDHLDDFGSPNLGNK